MFSLKVVSAVFMVLMVALSNTLMAQSTPSCTSEGQDADGDRNFRGQASIKIEM